MTPNAFIQPSLEFKEGIVMVKGTITFETVVDIWKKGLVFIHPMETIQVDLGDLVQCDSSVLALCTAWLRSAYFKKKSVIFLNVPSFMQDLIRVYGLDLILPTA